MAIAVTLTPGTPTTGLWCDTCQLPSLVRIRVHTMTAEGVGIIGSITRCTNCQGD